MAHQTLSAKEQEALRQLNARIRELDQSMLENLLRKGLIKPVALGGYALKIEGRVALRVAPKRRELPLPKPSGRTPERSPIRMGGRVV
jgi:hypothetical protein